VRLLEIFQFRDGLYLRRKVWVSAGRTISADSDGQGEQVKEPLSALPDLEASLRNRQACAEIQTSSAYMMWMPIWLNDKPIAAIEISGVGPLSPEARSVVDGILHVYRNYQSLLDYSERDSLTGLLNRKTFDENFSKVAFSLAPGERNIVPEDGKERRHAEGAQHWLAVIDIDHFKRVNDEYGHLYGDEVLILVANLLKTSFRAQDRVFRFGGEEFVVLLRSVTLENANKILERFRKRVEAHDFPQVGKVTVSLGYVGISSNMPVVILGHADQALYYAKEHGRNRTCFYDELVEAGLLQSETASSSVEFF
jgi:diguanylate cyclase (GGDEF)-like protein